MFDIAFIFGDPIIVSANRIVQLAKEVDELETSLPPKKIKLFRKSVGFVVHTIDDDELMLEHEWKIIAEAIVAGIKTAEKLQLIVELAVLMQSFETWVAAKLPNPNGNDPYSDLVEIAKIGRRFYSLDCQNKLRSLIDPEANGRLQESPALLLEEKRRILTSQIELSLAIGEHRIDSQKTRDEIVKILVCPKLIKELASEDSTVDTEDHSVTVAGRSRSDCDWPANAGVTTE